MAWSLVASTTFTGPKAPVAAGAALQDNWIDVSGNANEVLANGLVAQASAIDQPWLNARLMRPMAEARGTARAVFTFVAAQPTSADVAFFAFVRGNHATSAFTGYIVGISGNNGNFVLFPCTGGAVGTLVNSGALSGITAGTQYKLDIECTQANPTTTDLVLTLRNLADTALATATVTDTTAGLQNITGVAGVCINRNGNNPVGVGRIAAISTYQVAATVSTAYTASVPSAGAVGVAATITLTPNNSGPSAATVVTPAVVGGGTFSPATVTFAQGSAAAKTLTYTALSPGAKTISFTNNGGLGNPTDATFTASVANIVGVAGARFSPGNWKGDTGRGGTAFRKTWNPGAWFIYQWAASAAPSASILIPATATTARLSIYLNGVLTDDVAATGNVALSGIVPSAPNTLKAYLRDSTHDLRWNDGVNTLAIQGLLLDSGSIALAPPSPRPWALLVGDSITEAEKANGGLSGIPYGYVFHLEQALGQLGYDVGVSACSRNGWLQTGDTSDDVPAYYKVNSGVYSDAQSRWNKIDQGVSLLDSNGHISAYGGTGQEPSLIFINLLTNEVVMAANVADTQASAAQALVALRGAAPNAAIVVIVPPGLYDTTVPAVAGSAPYIAALKAGFDAYVAAHPNDGLVELTDLGLDFAKTLSRGIYTADGVHPDKQGHALMASAFWPHLAKALGKTANRWTYSDYQQGGL